MEYNNTSREDLDKSFLRKLDGLSCGTDYKDKYSEVTGDFDEYGELANPDIKQLLDLRPDIRDTRENNGNSSGNNKNQKYHSKKDEKLKPQHPVFKYSSRLRGLLHEAILLGSEPFFLTYSNGHLGLVKDIEEANRILRPPCIEEYPYEPIEFDSLKEIKEYEGMALTETLDSLYQKVKTVVILYIDQDMEIIILISSDIIWTYFQDLFPTTHYYDVTGKENGIGKSTIGHVFEGIAYRGVRMTDPSAANLYRTLGKIEPGQCIIIADEADRIHQDKDMLSILKEGYAIGGKVPKINTNTLKQEFFYCYCFKIRIAEESLRGNVTKGVIDRSFLIKATKGRPDHDIKEVLHPANRNERLEKLHNDLRSLKKLLLVYRLIHFTDSIPDIQTGLDARDKELAKPLMQLFNGTKAYAEVRSTLQTFLSRKNKRKKNTAIEPVIYGIVLDLVSRLGKTIPTRQVWQAIKDSVPGSYDEKKPNEYQTQDYDTIYRSTISKTISDNFGAEREHRRDGNVFVFDLEKLAKAGKVYDIEINIQTNLDIEGCESCEGREGQNSLLGQITIRKIIESDKTAYDISNENGINKKTSEKVNDKKESIGTICLSHPSQASQIQNPNAELVLSNPRIYRIGHTDRFGCQDCKVKGDKYAMEDHNCSGSLKEGH
jgi:hypothetical protein